ncbi:hypothetical protein [Streptomyces violascens]|uniref:Uncharacterized protein n=1 Tax=Streptomyces violascens TaxID=67381 RepID=A0ABQ3QV77_9ACTN|nr:hypothetical protein [Streptomyces violascens]GGU26337.1 hypothetical protein GCM10010289_54540 [Streptomyces violascens]GHI41191.1 hypothetical protein Sviol_55990 [Streptomyces violascens]
MLTTKPGQPSLDLPDALLRRPLIRPVHILRDHLIEPSSQLSEVSAKILA